MAFAYPSYTSMCTNVSTGCTFVCSEHMSRFQLTITAYTSVHLSSKWGIFLIFSDSLSDITVFMLTHMTTHSHVTPLWEELLCWILLSATLCWPPWQWGHQCCSYRWNTIMWCSSRNLHGFVPLLSYTSWQDIRQTHRPTSWKMLNYHYKHDILPLGLSGGKKLLWYISLSSLIVLALQNQYSILYFIHCWSF